MICINFCDLNKPCPKDKFPLPITIVVIDNTYGFESMAFMDNFSAYNQIKIQRNANERFSTYGATSTKDHIDVQHVQKSSFAKKTRHQPTSVSS